MEIPSILIREFVAIQVGFFSLTVLSAVISSARAEELELTGIVRQAAPPNDPAKDSTVKVFEKGGRTPIAGPDTTDANGRYNFKVAKGKTVIVYATWNPEKSTPGTKEAEVQTDPTVVDVQLEPPPSAPESQWLEAGRQAAKFNGNMITLVPSDLRQAEVPPASIFEFVRGARIESKDSFKNLAGVDIFDSADPKIIIKALQEVDGQFKTSGSVPNYDELASKVSWSLTHQQHLEILGFIAPPPETQARGQWELAIEKSVGTKFRKSVLASEKAAFTPDAEVWQMNTR
jgi:hypothetical protein